jgi:hypothetical protein
MSATVVATIAARPLRWPIFVGIEILFHLEGLALRLRALLGVFRASLDLAASASIKRQADVARICEQVDLSERTMPYRTFARVVRSIDVRP